MEQPPILLAWLVEKDILAVRSLEDARDSRRNVMDAERVTRRKFLATASVGTAVLASKGMTVQGAPQANERISIGMIGTGHRGNMLIDDIIANADKHNVEITAVCDVWQVNLNQAAAAVEQRFGKKPRSFTRYGDLLALEDVDAVVIATPDFAHTPIMIDALRAGKDVYVEKPMAIEIDKASEALDLARRRKRVVQVGTQRRSSGQFRAAVRTVASGKLGHISRISGQNNFNQARWVRDCSDCKRTDVDWDAYLFNRTKCPFDPRLLRCWQLYKMFTNGISGLWMTHLVDAGHMLTGATYPASAVAHGGKYVWKHDREHTDTFHALLDYPEGFLFDWGMGLGNSAGGYFGMYGTLGKLDLESWMLSGDGGAGQGKIGSPHQIEPEPGESHMGNWLTCLRSRQRPNADIETGHQHTVATIMAAAALETGQRQTYDRKTRQIRVG